MKKFICVSPFQPADKLNVSVYKPADNDKLAFSESTRFPIIPVINGYAEAGETIELITIVSDYSNSKKNYETLLNEAESLAIAKNINIVHHKIEVPYDSSLEVQFKIFTSLISHTADNDKLFCDITYGTKVMNQILTMGVNYGYSIHSDVTIGCIVYGEFDHESKSSKIYDITSLTYLNEIVKILADNKVSDPEKKIKAFLNWEK